jgi:hypothetical protein
MAKKASTLLKEIVETETLKIKDTFSGSSYHAIQHILRRLDFIMLFYNDAPDKTRQDKKLKSFVNFTNLDGHQH